MIQKQPDILGSAGLLISLAGAIASITSTPNSLLPISIGSTIGIGCNLFSRKQTNDILIDAYNSQQQKIENLIQQININKNELKDTLIANQTELANKLEALKLQVQDKLEEQKKSLALEVSRLDGQNEKLGMIVGDLQQIENLSQQLRVKPDSSEFFYQRGISHEKLGDKVGAIEDYTEAIKIKPHFAQAYHKRGIMYVKADAKQKAVDDLRKASLLYFEQGDIESYHQAREMSKEIHEIQTQANGNIKQMVLGSQLFDSEKN